MGKPGFDNRCLNMKFLESLFQDLPAPCEVAAHDGMFGMSLVERSALILDPRTQKLRRMLILHFFNPLAISPCKKETDHAVGKDTVDKDVNNLAQHRFTAELAELALLWRR